LPFILRNRNRLAFDGTLMYSGIFGGVRIVHFCTFALLVFGLYFVPNVACVSGLCYLDYPFGFFSHS
jgi:hypothetical protein